MLEPGWFVRDVKGGKAIEVYYEHTSVALAPQKTTRVLCLVPGGDDGLESWVGA
jgi:hypothetical protein